MKKYTAYKILEKGKGSLHKLINQLDVTDTVFAADYESYDKTIKCYMSVDNRVDFLKANRDNPNLYEVILDNRSCTFVCDIDGCPILTEEDVNLFQELFSKHLTKTWPNLGEINIGFVWLKSLKEKTGSYHVIIHIINNDGARYGFSCFTQQRHFWATFPRKGPFVDIEIDGKKKLVIDDIYGRNRCLRTIWSSKLGQNRPVIHWKLGDSCGVKDTLVLQHVDNFLPVTEYRKQNYSGFTSGDIECGSEISNKDLIVNILSQCKWSFKNYAQWLRMNYSIKYLLGEEGLEVSTNFFKSLGWDSETEIDNNIEQYNSIIVREPCSIEQFYEICGVEQPIYNEATELAKLDFEIESPPSELPNQIGLSPQDIMIDEWLGITTVTTKTKQPKFTLKLANMLSSFLKHNMELIAGPWLQKQEEIDTHTMTIIKQLYKNPSRSSSYNIVDLSELLGVSNVKWNEEYNEARVRDYPPLDKHLFIRSGTGTGKTYKIFEQYALKEGKKILIICYRRMLTRDLMAYKSDEKFKDLDFGHYEEEDVANGLRIPNIFMCQLESLHKFSERINHYDVIVFDESENIISQVDNIKAGSQFERTRLLLNYILKNKCIIAMSANLNRRTFNFIKRFSNREIYAIKNNFLDKEGYKVELYLGWEEKIHKLVKEGKRLACAVNSRTKAEAFHTTFSKMYPEKKFLLMTSRTAKSNEEVMKNIDESWSKYDVVFYSSCIEAGVSYDIKDHFDHICAHFSRGANHYLSQYQSLFRVRHPKEKTIIMYIEKDNQHGYFPMNKKHLIHVYKLKAFAKQLTIQDRIAFKVTDLGKLEVNFDDPLNLTMIENLSFNMRSQALIKSLLVTELKEAGCKIIEGEEETYMNGEGEVLYKKSEDDYLRDQISKERIKIEDIRKTIEDKEESYLLRRNTFMSTGIISGEIIKEEGEPDIKLGEKAVEQLEKLFDDHKSLDAAVSRIQQYKRLDKYHRYLQKLEYLKSLEDSPVKIDQLDKMTQIGGHYHNSAAMPIIKAHDILTKLGYYNNNDEAGYKLTCPSIIMTKILFGEKDSDQDPQYDLYNKLFKPKHPSNWIYPSVLKSEEPSKKIKAYFRGILGRFNLNLKPLRGQDAVIMLPTTRIELKTIEGYKKKIQNRIKILTQI